MELTNQDVIEHYTEDYGSTLSSKQNLRKKILVDYEDHIRVLLTIRTTTCMYRGIVFHNYKLVEATRRKLHWPEAKEGEEVDEVDPRYKLTEEFLKDRTLYIEVRDDGKNRTPEDIKALLKPILRTQVTEVEEIATRLNVRSLIVEFDGAQVRFSNGGAKFLTRWEETEEPKVIQMALEIIRDPKTRWEENRTKCTDPVDNLFVRSIQQAQVTKLINQICEKGNMTLPIVFERRRVKVIITTESQKVYFDSQTVGDEDHPLIYFLLLKMLEDTDKYDADIAKKVHEIEANNFSIATYQVRNETEKREVIKYMKKYNPKSAFTVKGKIITVQHEEWVQRDQFEKDLKHIHEVFTDEVFAGNDIVAPLKNQALRVYFAKFRRFYYFFTHFQGEYIRVFISGEPSHNTCAIECEIHNQTLSIEYFFAHKTDRKAIKSTDFEGYGPRGMLLVKYIANRFRIPNVELRDNWKHKERITSRELKEIMQDMKAGTLHHLYTDNKKAIDHWYAFYIKHGVLNNVIEHGYYGAYGFKPTHGDFMTAKTASIVCAAYMSA